MNDNDVMAAYLALGSEEQKAFDKRYARLQNNEKAKALSVDKVAKTKDALKPFDRDQALEHLRGLRKHLETHRRKFQRGGLDYKEMTVEVERVRDLITLLELEL